MKLLAAGLLCALASPASAAHCRPSSDDWNDPRTIALSQSLPGDMFVARCNGGVIDFLYPSCMEEGSIYDGVPCPSQVAALAAVLRAEHPGSVAWIERRAVPVAVAEPVALMGSPAIASKRGGGPLSDAQKDRLLERLKNEAEKRAGGGDYSNPRAAPWVGAYRLSDGSLKMDAGGSMALEVWDCRLVRGRQCFAGFTAGKETVGLAIGFGLRSAAGLAAVPEGRTRWQLVPSVGFVIPYASAGAQAAPCLGLSLKIW